MMMAARSGPVWLADSPATTGRLRLNPDALGVLAALSGPLRVVGIFGPRQCGKSYLLNSLSGSTDFTVSSDDCFKTPIIFMSCLPDPQDPETTLVLLDSEGFEGDMQALEGRSCSPVFTLCLLLSSVFLYNTWGPVKCETLDQLLHMTFLTNLVTLPTDEQAKETFLPEFVWCVRDVDLVMTFGNIQLVPADFLDSVLNDIQDQQSPSGFVCQIFHRSRMKLLDFCRPKANVEDLVSSSSSELNPCFIKQTETLRKLICRSKPKAFPDGHSTNGRELVTLMEQLVDCISNGSVMDLSNVTEQCEPVDNTTTVSLRDQSNTMNKVELSDHLNAPLEDDHSKKALLLERKNPMVETVTYLSHAERGSYIPALRPKDQEPAALEDELQVRSEPVVMQAPICLIENSTKNELVTNQQALNILSSIKQPVVVVSIVGMYRTGKSYLMNRLAGMRKGFSLGSTIQSETKGIWIWCVPHPEKKGHTLVLLDTEGLGDVEKGDQRNDHWIFALAVLLSSTLVYNSTGTINNDAVLKLEYVTELTKHIKVKSRHEAEDEASSEYLRFFPSFIWAVRDFTLDLEADGKPITADEYLENSLKLKSGYSKEVLSSNSARQCIRDYFPSRKCFVFDQPVQKEKLKIIDTLDDTELDANFVKQATEFCTHVFNNSQAKTIKGGITVTGRLLGNLAVTYVDSIRSGQVPCLENAVVALAQIENSSAVEKATSLYRQLLKERVVLHTETQEELSQAHEGCLKEALEHFMNHSFKDEDQRYQKILMEHIKEEYKMICQTNESFSQNFCTALLLQLEESMEPEEFYMRPGGYLDFKTDMEKFVQMYRSTPGKGIKAELALEEYLTGRNELGKVILRADKNLSEQQRQLEAEQARAEVERCKALAVAQQNAVMERRLKDQQEAQRENERQLREKLDRDYRSALQEHNRVLDQKLREQNALLREGFNKESEKLQAEINRLREMTRPQERSGGGGKLCVIS
ncbi:guanylate-binding protein 1-like [Scleropages formosus]|uniref:Guanylate-binding protein 1-like n=1 Tax=Scleropages formosus TaxID=113540 RepID=A0A8C9RFR0_SCLFO|nr:guanylate-binding protein 1-like [Scleropages formosus]XP_029104611.1 guanylate-binding protein 1-like [Scleropages formosus]